MTIRQKQHLLGYLGYYTGDVDGIWGALSRQATQNFQREHGLAADGVFGDATAACIWEVIGSGTGPVWTEEVPAGSFWTEIKYFSRGVFRCTCGGRGCNGFPAEPVERLVRNADAARAYFGRPALVSSGVRCRLRNSELPGSAANSLHLSGRAMDFAVSGIGAESLLAYVRQLPEVHETYAIDENYVHMGVQKI